MEKLIKKIKSEELSIFLLEERIKIISPEIQKIDNYLDKYGNYKINKIKSLNNKFNELLENLSHMKYELKVRRIYRQKIYFRK
jgi:hypothetical protein